MDSVNITRIILRPLLVYSQDFLERSVNRHEGDDDDDDESKMAIFSAFDLYYSQPLDF